VFQSLYFWGNLALKNHKPMVYILISTEVLENSRYDIQPVQENLIHEETPMVSFSQLPIRPQEKTSEQIMDERFARRVKGSSIINIVKTALFLALFGLWCALLYSERDVVSTSWMNAYLKKTYYSFGEMKRYGAEDYRRFIVGEVLHIQFNDIWEIINNIQNTIFTYKSDPSPIIKILSYASLRQIRTKTYECSEGGQNLTCYESKIYIDFDGYNVDKEKYGNGEDGFEFEDNDSAYYISGQLHSYPMYGHTVYLSTHNLNDWHKTYLKLKSHNWIDAGTRAVFITLNFVNPNVSMISVVVICIEIGSGGNLITTFLMKSVDYSIYDPVSVGLQVIIIALLVIEWILVGRDLFKPVEEIDYLALKYLPNKVVLFRHSRDMIRSWEQYDKKPICKRLRMPYFGEGLILVSFLIISLVQMCKLIWYHTELKSELDFDDTAYVNLYSISEDYNWIVNMNCFITLFFGISMVQYTLIWIHDISIYSTMLSMSIREIGWYIIACIPCVIAFIVLFYETLGPFEYAYSSFDRAFLGLLSTFLGDWKISGSYVNHVWLGMVVISFAILLLSKGAFYIAQVLNIQWHLMEARNIIVPNENYRSLRKKQVALSENGIKMDGGN
jgi:hypothetical protein